MSSPTEGILGSIDKTELTVIVCSSLGALIVIILVIVVICQFCCNKEKSDKAKLMESQDASHDNIGNLIPPIFYTQEMKDPLLQDDLCERYRG